jgi:hypothetical protein
LIQALAEHPRILFHRRTYGHVFQQSNVMKSFNGEVK